MPIAVGTRNTAFISLIKGIGKIAFYPFFQIQTRGLNNLPGKDAFILLPKHQRWEDIPILSFVIPKPLFYIAKYELFVNPVSGWFLSSMGGIPLNRERPLESRQFLKVMLKSLKMGEGVVIFPEGTYYQNAVGPGHVGLIRMILSQIPIPVIPVGIQYKGNRCRKRVGICIGRPIHCSPKTDAPKLLARIMEEIGRLSGL
jgi:1-acyl-sn-glycerol-3-phosphate acyltransferase